MKQMLISLFVVLILVATSPSAHAEDIVAILDLEFIEDTGETAAVLCLGDDDSDCVPWATFYVFEATPLRVIKGELPEEPFAVLFGRHALKKQDFYDVVAMIEHLEDADPDRPQYQILKRGERLSMYCFDRQDGDEAELAVELNDSEQLKCFHPERF